MLIVMVSESSMIINGTFLTFPLNDQKMINVNISMRGLMSAVMKSSSSEVGLLGSILSLESLCSFIKLG